MSNAIWPENQMHQYVRKKISTNEITPFSGFHGRENQNHAWKEKS